MVLSSFSGCYHKTIIGTTDEMQSNGHVWFMTILELLFFGLHSMDGQLNGWISACSWATHCTCVCVCLVRACVHFMAYLQAQLTASCFLIVVYWLLAFAYHVAASNSSVAWPTLRLLNLVSQRDFRMERTGKQETEVASSALGIFSFLFRFPFVSFRYDPPVCCSCTLPDLLPLKGQATNSLPRAASFGLICQASVMRQILCTS